MHKFRTETLFRSANNVSGSSRDTHTQRQRERESTSEPSPDLHLDLVDLAEVDQVLELQVGVALVLQHTGLVLLGSGHHLSKLHGGHEFNG